MKFILDGFSKCGVGEQSTVLDASVGERNLGGIPTVAAVTVSVLVNVSSLSALWFSFSEGSEQFVLGGYS